MRQESQKYSNYHHVIKKSEPPTDKSDSNTSPFESADDVSWIGQTKNIGQGRSKADNARGIDAYTKVIAEGARYQCVKNLGEAATDESRMYFADGDRESSTTTWPYVTTEWLWSNWLKYFNRHYGIPDARVIDAIRMAIKKNERGLGTTTDPGVFTDHDYDLQAERPGRPT